MWFIALAMAQPPDEEAVRDAMSGHWTAAVGVRDAVLANDLPKVRSLAGEWVKTPAEKGADEVVVEARLALMGSFKTLSSLADVSTAAKTVGQLGATCAGCHQRYERKRSFVPPAGPRTRSTMDTHKAGLEWMWAGLVGRSETMFEVGARTLQSSVLATQPGGGEAQEKAALAFATSVQEVAKRALTVKSDRERGEVFGTVLGTCSGCHVITDGGPFHAGRPVRAGDGVLVAEMHERYADLEAARKALKAGDLAGVRQAGERLATMPAPSGLEQHPWRPWAAEVRKEATALAAAKSAFQARQSLVDLALACGSCHGALGGGPHVPTEDELKGAPTEAEDALWLALLSGDALHLADQRSRELIQLWSKK